MNPRYLETFRRHRILFLLTIVVAVVLATWASLGEPALYRSSTSLWSDTPTGAATAFGTPPPAAQEQTMLNELLTTQYFRTQVARGGPLAEYLEGAPPRAGGRPRCSRGCAAPRPSTTACRRLWGRSA